MLYDLFKIALSALLVYGISELARRDTLAGALLAAVPVVSVLGICWFYLETRDGAAVARLCRSIFWLVLPSLPFFLALPALLDRGVPFLPALGLSLALTVLLYALLLAAGSRLGLPL